MLQKPDCFHFPFFFSQGWLLISGLVKKGHGPGFSRTRFCPPGRFTPPGRVIDFALYNVPTSISDRVKRGYETFKLYFVRPNCKNDSNRSKWKLGITKLWVIFSVWTFRNLFWPDRKLRYYWSESAFTEQQHCLNSVWCLQCAALVITSNISTFLVFHVLWGRFPWVDRCRVN